MAHNHGHHHANVDIGLLLIRLMLGVVFVFHGSQKLFGLFDGPGVKGFAGYLESLNVPYPLLSAYLAGSAEFVGGIAMLLGVGLPVAAVLICCVMGVAIFKVHLGGFSGQSGGMEYPLTLAVVAAAMGMLGPGRFAMHVGRHKRHEREHMHVVEHKAQLH